MFFQNLDSSLENLLTDGAIKLSPIQDQNWREKIFHGCMREIEGKSYGENLPTNIRLLTETNILTQLAPRLADIAMTHFEIKVNLSDIYNVCRLVRPGDMSEGYRGHFDSHLFTLVIPINIPEIQKPNASGELHYFPNTRLQPKNELRNICEKLYYKKYNSEAGFNRLSEKKHRVIDNFKDYRPLLFLGNSTYHGNSPVEYSSVDCRMTILTHFFDPSPQLGIGRIMRKLRRR